MSDRLFEESSEERRARLRRRFETSVDSAATALKKAEEEVPKKQDALDQAKKNLADFDAMLEESDEQVRLADERFHRALERRGVDPRTGEVSGDSEEEGDRG